MTTSPGWGASSGTISVFHVPSIKKLLAPTPRSENVVEFGLEEPAVAVLRDDHIARLGRELRDDFSVPRAFDQEVAGADAEIGERGRVRFGRTRCSGASR